MQIQVKTVEQSSAEYTDACERILRFVAEDVDIDFRLKENYTEKRLQLDKQLAVSYYYCDDTVYGFSTVLHRGCFHNGARFLNRFLKSPGIRFINGMDSKMKSYVSESTQTMIKQQLGVIEAAGFDFGFMSREGNMTKNNMIHFTKSMPFVEWFTPAGRFQVCEGDHTCWQQIVLTTFVDDCLIKMKHISEEQYYELQKG